VFNPDGILYGRLSGFGLSKLGHRMAQAAAAELVARHRPVVTVASSSLQRARESAAPIAAAFGLEPVVEDRVIEPRNRFEGTVATRSMRLPTNWPWLVNPWRPSWGEPYTVIAERMRAAVNEAFDALEAAGAEAAAGDSGDAEPRDAVLVSHQLPIWVLHLSLTGERFLHDPRKRRCMLSSITTFERHDGELVEVGYTEPARSMQENATDVGAV
jgi:broad specificity phosphatase PhoE